MFNNFKNTGLASGIPVSIKKNKKSHHHLSISSEIKKLADLKERKLISEKEYKATKNKLIKNL